MREITVSVTQDDIDNYRPAFCPFEKALRRVPGFESSSVATDHVYATGSGSRVSSLPDEVVSYIHNRDLWVDGLSDIAPTPATFTLEVPDNG